MKNIKLNSLSRKQVGMHTFFAFIATLIWSSNPLVLQSLLKIPVFELATLIFLSAFLYSQVAYIMKPRSKRKNYYPRSKKMWLVGCLCMFLMQHLYTLAFHFLNPAQVELTYYLWPLFLTCFCLCAKTIRFSMIHIIALIICFLGVYICVASSLDVETLSFSITGILLAICAALSWSFYNFYCKVNSLEVKEQQSCIFAGPCALMSFLIHMFSESFVLPSTSNVIAILFLGVLTMGISLTLWNRGVLHGNFKLITLFPYCVPILSILFLVIFQKATFTPSLVIAGGLVSIGTFLPLTISKPLEAVQ